MGWNAPDDHLSGEPVDRLRAAVAPGPGTVARWPGVVCVAQSDDPAELAVLLRWCAAVAGPAPGRPLARLLTAWLAGSDGPAEGLRFGTVAATGPDQWAVFLFGAVELHLGADGRPLSGTDAATWTDRLVPHPRTSPVVLALSGRGSAGGADEPAAPIGAHLDAVIGEVHDLRTGAVPGAGVVLLPDAEPPQATRSSRAAATASDPVGPLGADDWDPEPSTVERTPGRPGGAWGSAALGGGDRADTPGDAGAGSAADRAGPGRAEGGRRGTDRGDDEAGPAGVEPARTPWWGAASADVARPAGAVMAPPSRRRAAPDPDGGDPDGLESDGADRTGTALDGPEPTGARTAAELDVRARTEAAVGRVRSLTEGPEPGTAPGGGRHAAYSWFTDGPGAEPRRRRRRAAEPADPADTEPGADAADLPDPADTEPGADAADLPDPAHQDRTGTAPAPELDPGAPPFSWLNPPQENLSALPSWPVTSESGGRPADGAGGPPDRAAPGSDAGGPGAAGHDTGGPEASTNGATSPGAAANGRAHDGSAAAASPGPAAAREPVVDGAAIDGESVDGTGSRGAAVPGPGTDGSGVPGAATDAAAQFGGGTAPEGPAPVGTSADGTAGPDDPYPGAAAPDPASTTDVSRDSGDDSGGDNGADPDAAGPRGGWSDGAGPDGAEPEGGPAAAADATQRYGATDRPGIEPAGADDVRAEPADGPGAAPPAPPMAPDTATFGAALPVGGHPESGAANQDRPLDVDVPATPGGHPVLVPGRWCPRGHLTDPRVGSCGGCGAPVDPAGAVVVGPRPPLGLIVFDDGGSWVLDGGYLLGRLPDVDGRVRSGALRPLAVADQSGAVSRAHAEVRLEEWDVLLVDAGSRNGTLVAGPDEVVWSRLPPRQLHRAVPGTRVRLGGRTFQFEPPPAQFEPPPAPR